MTTLTHPPEGVVADTLFVGLTRPALVMGVPYAALLASGVLTVEAFLLTRNLLALLAIAPLLGLCRLVCATEPRYFELVALWARAKADHFPSNAAYWRARALAPLTYDADPRVRL